MSPLLRLTFALLAALLCLSANGASPLLAVLRVGAAVVLTPGAAAIESKFPAQTAAAELTAASASASSGYPSRSLTPLRATVTAEAATLIQRAGVAFKATRSSFDMRFDNANSYPKLKEKFLSKGGFDMAIIAQGTTEDDYLAMPGLQHYPIQANAIVFSFNLGSTLTGGRVLALRPATLCRIFRGNITRWNDDAIRQDNPAMTALATTAADQPITILTLTVPAAMHYWLSTFCGKVG